MHLNHLASLTKSKYLLGDSQEMKMKKYFKPLEDLHSYFPSGCTSQSIKKHTNQIAI